MDPGGGSISRSFAGHFTYKKKFCTLFCTRAFRVNLHISDVFQITRYIQYFWKSARSVTLHSHLRNCIPNHELTFTSISHSAKLSVRSAVLSSTLTDGRYWTVLFQSDKEEKRFIFIYSSKNCIFSSSFKLFVRNSTHLKQKRHFF